MNILVVDLLNIGDLLFTTPALRMLRSAYPDSKIDMLVHGPFSDVVSSNPNLNKIIKVDKHRDFKSLSGLLRVSRMLQETQYDFALDLHGSGKSILATYFSGAGRKIGFSPVKWIYNPTLKSLDDVHRVDKYISAVNDLGVPISEHDGMECWTSAESDISAEAKWSATVSPEGNPLVGMNPGARLSVRQWPVERWVELADALGNEGLRTVLFGGLEDQEMAQLVYIKAIHKPAVFTGKLTLQELAAVIHKCAVFVTADTGPMHIAAARKTPVVALFGPGTPELATGPYMTPNIVCRSGLPCPGCDVQHKHQAHVCMSNITATEVREAVETLIRHSISIPV